MNRYIIEFIGTFFLMFTVAIAPSTAPMLAPVAIGAILMVMVFTGGHISGGHFNPAVSLGAMLRGALPSRHFGPYAGAQILGALLAAILAGWVHGGEHPLMELNLPRALVAEGLFTFALVTVVLNTATVRSTEGNSFYGLAIGSTVMVGAFILGGISGAAFNPAVTIGVFFFGAIDLTFTITYIVVQLAAGALAALVFKSYCPEAKPAPAKPQKEVARAV